MFWLFFFMSYSPLLNYTDNNFYVRDELLHYNASVYAIYFLLCVHAFLAYLHITEKETKRKQPAMIYLFCILYYSAVHTYVSW